MSHTVEFTCQDCREDILVFGSHDGIPVCQTCRFRRSVAARNKAEEPRAAQSS